MSRSLLYAADVTTQALFSGDTISFGDPIRRYGTNIRTDGGNILINGVGYYTQTINLTFTAGATGNVTFTLYKDGVAIQGATGTMSVVSGNTYNVVIPCAYRQMCCCESVIVAVTSGQTLSITNAAVEVVKE